MLKIVAKAVAAENNSEITVDKEINPMYVCHIVTSMFGNMIVGMNASDCSVFYNCSVADWLISST